MHLTVAAYQILVAFGGVCVLAGMNPLSSARTLNQLRSRLNGLLAAL